LTRGSWILIWIVHRYYTGHTVISLSVIVSGHRSFRCAKQDVGDAFLLFVFEIAKTYKSEGGLVLMCAQVGL